MDTSNYIKTVIVNINMVLEPFIRLIAVYNHGRNTLKHGRNTLNHGRNTLNHGRNTLNHGRNTLNDGRNTRNYGRKCPTNLIVLGKSIITLILIYNFIE